MQTKLAILFPAYNMDVIATCVVFPTTQHYRADVWNFHMVQTLWMVVDQGVCWV